jgi:drug/metabolite transporter (DMT)-like permease
VGVVLVVAPSLGGAVPTAGLIGCLLALAGGTAGTLWQKRWGDGIPLLWGTSVQYGAATVVLAVASLAVEDQHVAWTARFVGALAWLVLALSLGAVLLLMVLLRRGTASSVSSLLYLVPPVTALETWVLFGERMTALSMAGVGMTALGVALAVRTRQRQPT